MTPWSCPGLDALRVAALIACAALASACSTARPWINAPLGPDESVRYDGLRQIADPSRSADLLVVVSFSGGGSRAAALAHAALAALDRVPLYVDGRTTTLTREIDVVTGVSGGSIAAAHLALHGVPRFLEHFPADFLDVDFGNEVVRRALSPAGMHRLGSAHLGRGNALADALDARLFDGATFGSLATLPERPYLIIGATDLASGAEFDFASDQFGRLCSAIDDVPLAFAVAASSAVPIVFTPLTLANHGPRCPRPTLDAAPDAATGEMPSRAQLVSEQLDQYADPGKQFIHLVDGAVSDNLGVRRILDYVAQVGGIAPVLQLLATDGRVPRHLVFVNVGSERRGRSGLDSTAETPGTLQVLGALVDRGVGRASRATELAFMEATAGWLATLREMGPPYSEVDVYSIQVDLSSSGDAALQAQASEIPTVFRIQPEQRAILAGLASAGIAASTDFTRLRAALVQ
jgi:NTE family protein